MAYIGNTAETQAFTPAIDYFNGNGSTVAFTLSRPVASVAQVQAVIENVPQNPGDAFTVSGNTITFTSAPPIGTNNIYVYYTSPITQLSQPGQGTVSPSSLSTGGPYWDTSGNLGIGTSSPDQALDVVGNIIGSQSVTIGTSGLYQAGSIYSDSNWGMLFRAKQASPASADFMWANSAGTEHMRITSTGDVVVNGSSGAQSAKFTSYSTGFNPAAAFYFGGTPGATLYNLVWFGSLGNGAAGALLANQNTVTLASVSDYRTKTNVEPLTNGISRVMQLAPKKFNWVGLEGETKTEGFIAHEVQSVVPDATFGEKDAVNEDGSIKKQMMDASKLIPLLTSAIQEQQAIIEDLKARIETLESK